MLLIIASINFGRLNKIRVKSKMSRSEKKGNGGKHTRPKKWSGARRPAGQATTALTWGRFVLFPFNRPFLKGHPVSGKILFRLFKNNAFTFNVFSKSKDIPNRACKYRTSTPTKLPIWTNEVEKTNVMSFRGCL